MPVSAQAAELIAAGRLAEAEALLMTQWRAGQASANAGTRGDAALLAALGLVAFRRGDLITARRWLEQAVAADPGQALAHSNLAAVLARLEELLEAERHARAALALDPAADEALITLAECLSAGGQYDEAERCYARAARFPQWKVAGLVRFGRDFFVAAQAHGENDALPAVTMLAQGDPERAAHLLYIAASGDYFEHYGGSLLESLSANDGEHREGLVHLHLLGEDAGLMARMARLPARYAGLNLAVSAESPDLDGQDRDERVAFYTAARFLRVAALLRAHGKPVVTLDIDAIIEQPIGSLVAAARGADLALTQRRPQRIAWTNVLAGAAVFNPTPAAAAYARLVKGYIEASMAARRLSWNLDQVALYCALVMQRRFGTAPAVAELNAAADAAIHQLSPLRGDKRQDPKYLEYYADI